MARTTAKRVRLLERVAEAAQDVLHAPTAEVRDMYAQDMEQALDALSAYDAEQAAAT
jgi:hypothetical protein